MNIGILTLPLHTNYGGILQAYALQNVLEQLGHQAEHILRNSPPGILPWHQGLAEADVLYMQQHTDRFINHYIHGTKNAISAVNPGDYDAIVVGSDQIWRYMIANGMCGNFEDVFLRFTEGWDVRRIAYAPSFGLDTWEAPESMIPVVSHLLKQFDAVSARESSGVTMCRELLGVEAQHVVDPTMLLQRADYERLIDACPTPATTDIRGGLMCYVLDETPEKTALIDAVAQRYGLTPFRTNSRVEQTDAPLADRVQPPLEEWLRSFRDASMVITDSFHASVFSILFGKPFIVTGNPLRGLARLQSLLALLQAEEHLVISTSDFHPDCDYAIHAHSYELLDAARSTSLNFLKKALK